MSESDSSFYSFIEMFLWRLLLYFSIKLIHCFWFFDMVQENPDKSNIRLTHQLI